MRDRKVGKEVRFLPGGLTRKIKRIFRDEFILQSAFSLNQQ